MPHAVLEGERLLVGTSDRTKQVLRQVDRVAQGRWPVLILGETGTGKEVVARSIHEACPNGAFVTIDCSSLVGSLMESELFGHAKGSFTGAVGAKTGLIELANGGTAFFDEIGELPLDVQAKLLRVLQEKEFRPVGSLTTRRSDFRIIAATNRDLAKEVERGNFRRDLYYRLNVVSIRLTPLRERKDDIAPLAAHFLNRYGSGQEIAPEAMDVLLEYEWPGNVRELENCIQRMVAMTSGPTLRVNDMPSCVQGFVQARQTLFMAAAVGSDYYGAAKMPVRCEETLQPSPGEGPIVPLLEIERRAILHALEYTKGDRGVAAHLLGIGRTTLYRKLKEYHVAA